MIVAETNMWYCEGTSDKVYTASVTREGESFALSAKWGRRGNTQSHQVKGYFISERDAMIAYGKLIAEKTRKGYQITGRTVQVA